MPFLSKKLMEKNFFLMMNMFFVIVCSSCHFFHAAWWGGGSAKMLDWFFRLSLEYYVDRFQQSIILDGKSITWIYSFIFVQWQLIALYIYIDTYRMENQFDYCRHQHNIKSYYFLIQCLCLLIPITHKQRSMFQSESIQGCKCHIVFEIRNVYFLS